MRHLDALQQGMVALPIDRKESNSNNRGSDHHPHHHHGGSNNNSRWGLESYYKALDDEELEATKDTRKLFNPYPDLVHDNIFKVAKGITSILDVTIDVLHKRLPDTTITTTTAATGSTNKKDDDILLPTFTLSTHFINDNNSDDNTNGKTKPLTVELKSTIPNSSPDPPFSPSYIPPQSTIKITETDQVSQSSSTLPLSSSSSSSTSPPSSSMVTSSVMLSKVDGLPLSTLGIEKEVTGNITESVVNNILNMKNYSVLENGNMKYNNNQTTDSMTQPSNSSRISTDKKGEAKSVTFDTNSDSNKNKNKLSVGKEAGNNKKPLNGNDKVFAEIDQVLGLDNSKHNSNYLNRDGLPVIVNTNIFPINTNNNNDKNEVKVVDEYLKNNYLPSSWDPRLSYHNNKINSGSSSSSSSSRSGSDRERIIVIHAPSDQELMDERIRYNNNHNYASTTTMATAPPQVVLSNVSNSPKYPSTYNSNNFNYYSYNNDTIQINRAVEGFSTSHIRNHKLVVNSDGKYILPTYNYINEFNNDKGSSSSSSNTKDVVNLKSPDIQSNIYEREKYLNKMKKLRQTMIVI